MSEWRGFHYQTGEIAALINELKQAGLAKADIDQPYELDIFHDALAEAGIVLRRDIPPDYAALDLNKYPEFFVRHTYTGPEGDVHVDYFLVDQKEETYADVFFD